MLFENPYWIIIKKKDWIPSALGKWIWEAPLKTFLNEQFAAKMDSYVESGEILLAKFARKDPYYDPFPFLKDSVLCVYTSTKEEVRPKELVTQILGFEPVGWKSEEETKRDWKPNGALRKQYDDYWKK